MSCHSNTTPRCAGIGLRLFVVVVLWGIAIGYVACQWHRAATRPIVPFRMQGDWITSPDPTAYSGYFRLHLDLPGRVKHAWVVVAADNAFDLTVNSNPVGQIYLYRPTRPYQTGLSEYGQRITSPQPALALNFPREYQWVDHDNTRLPVWLDVKEYLRPGANVVCVKVSARHQQPGLCLDGAIELWSGEVIPLRSGRQWRAEPVPPGIGPLYWTDPNYLDLGWRHAVKRSSGAIPFRAFDARIYQRGFTGHWLSAPGAPSEAVVWYRATWDIPDRITEASLRVMVNRPFEAFVNGQRLAPTTVSPSNLDSGNWVINCCGPWDDFRHPEVVDPDSIGSMFVGDEFLTPRHADPTYDPLESDRPINVSTRKPQETYRGDLPGTYEPRRDLNRTRRTPDKPDPVTERVPLRSLERDRATQAYYGYDVTALLKPGTNTFELRVAEPQSVDPLNWPSKVAVDGFVTSTDGEEHLWRSDSQWQCAVGPSMPREASWQSVQDDGCALTSANRVPRFRYRGIQWNTVGDRQFGLRVGVLVGLITVGLVAGSVLLRGWWGGNEAAERWGTQCLGALTVGVCVIACAALLEMSYGEREETLWSYQTWPWTLVLGLTGIVVAAALHISLVRRQLRQPLMEIHRSRRLLRGLAWNAMILGVLVLSWWLRARDLEFQPLDDDEYASVQAVLAIARTGAPAFVPEGIYYTRSPAYHYLTGGIVALFGENLRALRLPSVFFGVATVWLTYWMGVRLFRSHFVGLGAMLLMALHPFEIFTSHVARFYQQQQFFVLLTIYCFCKGFVLEQRQSYRYLTVVAFLITVLSQEISIVLAPGLLLGFMLFARDLGWGANLRLALAAVIAMGWIFLDWLAFQTLCLTRTEGVSPNYEATIKPHFWQVFHLFSLFIGYSRLHLSLSLFLALDFLNRWRNRPRTYLALVVLLVFSVVLTNLLMTHPSLRYLYALFPLWALLGVEGIRRVSYRLASWVAGPCYYRPGMFVAGLGGLFFLTVLMSWSPWRIVGTYTLKILPDSTGACQYVAQNLRSGDRVMITGPHPHAAYLEIGRADYDLSVPILLDFVMLRDGKLIDRNAGAEAVGSLAKLQKVLTKHDRVWILINKEKFRTRGKNMRWEYPAARIENYLRKNAELKHRTPFWYIYLWDAHVGRFRPFQGD